MDTAVGSAAAFLTPEQERWLLDVLGLDVRALQERAREAAGKPPAGGESGGLRPARPSPRGAIGPEQSARAARLLAAMSPGDQAQARAVLEKASPPARPYLQRALASEHGAAELRSFAQAIAGKDESWLDANLHVVGTSNGQPGIRQQWRDSCGPTTIQAMRAELDPIYALKLRTANPAADTSDGAGSGEDGQDAAEEQRAILDSHGGHAVPRRSAEQTPGQTYGMVLSKALNEATAQSGIHFAVEPFKPDTSLGEIDAALADRLPVPLRLGDPRQGHFVLVTAATGGPPRTYTIHDPWSGRSQTVTSEQIRGRSFNIAGYNEISNIYRPSAAADSP